MPDPIDRNISFRTLVRGEVDDFLNHEGLQCPATASCLVATASKLATLREEGLALSPEIYFCTDVNQLTSVLHGAEVMVLGSGPLEEATVLRALKECAPLAVGGWVMFVQRSNNRFTYGVLTSTNVPLAITPYEALVESPPVTTTSIVVRRLAENCVEMRGARGHRRCLYFSDQPVEMPPPARALERFCDAATRDVPCSARDLVFRYFHRSLADLLAGTHGTLLVVRSHRKRSVPTFLADSIILPQPLSIADRVRDYGQYKDAESLAKLDSARSLLRGMLASDGIVVFKSDAAVLAYRAFLTPRRLVSNTVSGGARTRVFVALRHLVDDHQLNAAFICSQDGRTDFAGNQDA